ncbi:substrate-binding periplasmic protein [Thalassotalea euphylliae]|uniref:substrate-binding periplasmic protein n=1 Tax=Thalassotalea euphylliae TaxID=1655234 RepID=UPI003626CC00
MYRIFIWSNLQHIGLALFIFFSAFIHAEELSVTIVTESLAPLQIDNGNSPPSGAMVEIVNAMLKSANIHGEVKIYPWARAYQMARTQENTLIFSIMRTPSREDKFQWVGTLYAATVHLMKLKERSDISVQKLEQVKQFNVGVTRSDISQEYLLSKGFEPDVNLMLNSSYPRLWESLFNGKVDFILANEFMWEERKKTQGDTYRPLEIALRLPDFATDYYLAASNNTSQKVITKLKKALEMLKQSGQYQAILAKWQLEN